MEMIFDADILFTDVTMLSELQISVPTELDSAVLYDYQSWYDPGYTFNGYIITVWDIYS